MIIIRCSVDSKTIYYQRILNWLQRRELSTIGPIVSNVISAYFVRMLRNIWMLTFECMVSLEHFHATFVHTLLQSSLISSLTCESTQASGHSYAVYVSEVSLTITLCTDTTKHTLTGSP